MSWQRETWGASRRYADAPGGMPRTAKLFAAIGWHLLEDGHPVASGRYVGNAKDKRAAHRAAKRLGWGTP